jgi:hypothetical protein
VVAAVATGLRPELGLCYVPDVVRGLLPAHSLEEVHAALLEAARSGRIELRPEAGLSRLSHDDLGLCPEGAHGTRLSWARPLGEGGQ